MRLAYLDSHAYPSSAPESLQTYHTCLGLAAHAETVWLMGGKGDRDPAAYYGVHQPANLRLVPLARFRRDTGWLRPTWTLPFHLLAVAALRRLTREQGIQAVLTRDLKLARFALRRRRALPPLFFESHQIFADTLAEEASRAGRDLTPKLRRLRRRETDVYAGADGMIVLTERLADMLRSRFRTRERILVAPDGVDLQGPVPVPPDAVRGPVTYLGNFHHWKGVEVLIQAAAVDPALRVRLVGGEPEPRARLERLANDLGVRGRVEFVGPVPPPDRWRYLAEAAACVLPLTRSAFGTSFTSPLKLFEYMAAARPIVASDLPAIREVLRDGQNALLVPPEDPPALAAALHRLQTDPGLVTRLAVQAASDVRAYTWEARGKRIVEFLHEAGVR
jgi:glycosyltransferase involved in cell wall biosynthesis